MPPNIINNGQMKNLRNILPYIIALLCAGFACTQDVSMAMIDWLSSLSMELNYGWFTALVTVLFAVWCVYRHIINWRDYKYSDAFSATLVFFAVTTLYYRFFQGGFEFVPLVWKITYVDVLWVVAIAFVIEAIVNKNAKRAWITDGESSILLDSPIETPEEDRFDYYSEALHIAGKLSELPENKSVSVAVLSPWGDGKTSFVNLIKYAIRHGDGGKPLFDHIIIEFNPRQSKDIKSIQEDFFQALINAIPNDSKFRKKISSYLENIGLQDIHPVAKMFAGLIKGVSKKDAADEVSEVLDGLKKRLIVFIDDFDRLTDAEIIEVLKLIDNNAAFRHTIFITAYDEGAVTNALKKYESAKGIAYIDKFFTLRFHLPLRSDLSVVETLYQLMKDKVADDVDLLGIMNSRYRIIADCIRNLRDVKNFFNLFQMDYVFNTKQKIDFDDYLLLELMKFRYYDEYCNLFKRVYVNHRSLFLTFDADAVYTLREEYSRDKQGKEPKGELPKSINILRSIFSEYKASDGYDYSTRKPSYRSVQFVRYFDMYFTNRGYGHVQAEGLESLFAMSNDEDIERFYRQCIQQKTQSDIIDYLRFQEWQDIPPKGALTKEETFKRFVKLVFMYSAIAGDNDTYIHALQLQLIYKSNFKEKGYNGMDEQAYHDYLLDVIYDPDNDAYIPLSFLINITHTLVSPTKEGEENAFILNSEEVKRKNYDLFKSFIATQQQYSDKLASLYRLCLDHIDNSRLIIMKKANDDMREFLYKDKSNEYLKGFLVFNRNGEQYISITFKDPFFKQIFPMNGEEDMFKAYVENALPEGDENRSELLAYLEKYRKAGSDHTGFCYIKSDNPSPTNMEMIESLEF